MLSTSRKFSFYFYHYLSIVAKETNLIQDFVFCNSRDSIRASMYFIKKYDGRRKAASRNYQNWLLLENRIDYFPKTHIYVYTNHILHLCKFFNFKLLHGKIFFMIFNNLELPDGVFCCFNYFASFLNEYSDTGWYHFQHFIFVCIIMNLKKL